LSSTGALDWQGRVTRLERLLKLAVGASVLALLTTLWVTLRARTAQDVLRARALIIEDARGRERVVLGAPIPDLEAGKRDSNAVAVGMLILNENGLDRVVVGAPVPGPRGGDGKVYARISPAAGIQFNDQNGRERGGLGYMDNGRVVMGLDSDHGEGVMTFVLPDGRAGFLVNGTKRSQRVFLGTSTADSAAGLEVNDAVGAKRIRVGVGSADSPALELLDKGARSLFKAP
jgi:hypothetical protein